MAYETPAVKLVRLTYTRPRAGRGPLIRLAYANPVDDAQALEAFHRLGWLVGQVVESLGGSPDRVDGHVACFQRESAEPPDGGSLVTVGVAVA